MEDLEYIIKFSVYQIRYSSFEKCVTIKKKYIKNLNIKSMRFLLALFNFDYDVTSACL